MLDRGKGSRKIMRGGTAAHLKVVRSQLRQGRCRDALRRYAEVLAWTWGAAPLARMKRSTRSALEKAIDRCYRREG